MTTLLDLDTPSLILDRAKLTANIERAQAACRRLGVQWRPHFKTHKCPEIAAMQVEGAHGPGTVSTIKEAEEFAAHGITDLIYAVGIAPHKLARLDQLNHAGADVKILLDSVEAARLVSAYCRDQHTTFKVLIEIDCDGHRSGLKPGDSTILAVAQALTDGASLVGVLTHAGGSYNCKTTQELRTAANHEAAAIAQVAAELRKAGYPITIVSAGSTPTLTYCDAAPGVTEYRSGVGTFEDLVMAGLGVCSVEDIAVSVLVSVIGRQEEKGWVLEDGGFLAMSRDRGTAAQKTDCGYGLVCDLEGNLIPGLQVIITNQEHGIIARVDGKPLNQADFPLDRRLRILPNHACPTAASFDRYYVVDGPSTEVSACWQRFNYW